MLFLHLKPLILDGLFIVTYQIYDWDFNNGVLCFIIYKPWHAQNIGEKTVVLWAIDCRSHINHGMT